MAITQARMKEILNESITALTRALREIESDEAQTQQNDRDRLRAEILAEIEAEQTDSESTPATKQPPMSAVTKGAADVQEASGGKRENPR